MNKEQARLLLSKNPLSRTLLYLLSLLYRSGLFFRNLVRRAPYRASIPVISIGNITAGGTGKTPFTIMLGTQLHNVAILTRGYKSKAEHTSGKCVDAQSAFANEVGDEACLMAKKLPQAKIYVGKRRVESAKRAECTGASCMLLDDGFQHERLHRDLNILLIDCENPFGGNHLLPLGTLREPLSAMKRADLIVLNRVERAKDLALLQETIQNSTSAPIVRVEMRHTGFKNLHGELVALQKCPVGLFCGLGNPQQFLDFVEGLGLEVRVKKFLEDHEAISKEELQALYEQVKGPILCTEKDMVKLPVSSVPVLAVCVEMRVTEGQEILEKALVKTVRGFGKSLA